MIRYYFSVEYRDDFVGEKRSSSIRVATEFGEDYATKRAHVLAANRWGKDGYGMLRLELVQNPATGDVTEVGGE